MEHAFLSVHIALLAVWFLQLGFVVRISVLRPLLHSVCEGNKVKFELPLLGEEIITRGRLLAKLLEKPHF